LTVVRTFSMRAGLVASTVTPGRIAPDVSRTTPAMDCADATCGNTHAMRARIPYNSHRGLSGGNESTTRLVIRCFSPVCTRTDLAVGYGRRAEEFYRVITESPNP